MADTQEPLPENAKETRKLLKELTKARRIEEVAEIKDQILEGLDKKVDAIKQLIREKKG